MCFLRNPQKGHAHAAGKEDIDTIVSNRLFPLFHESFYDPGTFFRQIKDRYVYRANRSESCLQAGQAGHPTQRFRHVLQNGDDAGPVAQGNGCQERGFAGADDGNGSDFSSRVDARITEATDDQCVVAGSFRFSHSFEQVGDGQVLFDGRFNRVRPFWRVPNRDFRSRGGKTLQDPTTSVQLFFALCGGPWGRERSRGFSQQRHFKWATTTRATGTVREDPWVIIETLDDLKGGSLSKLTRGEVHCHQQFCCGISKSNPGRYRYRRWDVRCLQMTNELYLKIGSVGVLLCLLGLSCKSAETERATIDVAEGAISFSAMVSRADFEEHSAMPGYHFVVWEGGRAGDGALFRSRVTDTEVLEALESLGARPGNALGLDVWDERDDPSSSAPDKIVEGPAVEILVRIPGRQEPLTLDEILIDPGGKGFDMRFGGHRANIPRWKSGCVVCLYSCPGSKVGNARYTVRDFVNGATRFAVREGALPADGTEVTLIFRLVEETTVS